MEVEKEAARRLRPAALGARGPKAVLGAALPCPTHRRVCAWREGLSPLPARVSAFPKASQKMFS